MIIRQLALTLAAQVRFMAWTLWSFLKTMKKVKCEQNVNGIKGRLKCGVKCPGKNCPTS